MPVYLVLDAAALILLIFFSARGYHKGFFVTVATAVIVIVAFIGSGMAARHLSPIVSDVIEQPILSILRSDEGAFEEPGERTELNGDMEILASLTFFGMSAMKAADFSDAALDVVAGAKDTLIQAVARAFSDTLAHFLVSAVSFILIVTVLEILRNAINHVFDLPVLNFLNRFAGLLTGLALGLFLCFILVTVLVFFDAAVPVREIEKTILFRVIFDNNFIAL